MVAVVKFIAYILYPNFILFRWIKSRFNNDKDANDISIFLTGIALFTEFLIWGAVTGKIK